MDIAKRISGSSWSENASKSKIEDVDDKIKEQLEQLKEIFLNPKVNMSGSSTLEDVCLNFVSAISSFSNHLDQNQNQKNSTTTTFGSTSNLNDNSKSTKSHNTKKFVRLFSRLSVSRSSSAEEFIRRVISNVCKQHQKKMVENVFKKFPKESGNVLCEFFFKKPNKLVEWFQFDLNGKNTKGALALEQYLFQNRDKVWNKIQWQGRRTYPPPVVIQKKALLFEIDVLGTLDSLTRDTEQLNNVEENDNSGWFWSSTFFLDSLQTGPFLELDITYFVNFFAKLIQKNARKKDNSDSESNSDSDVESKKNDSYRQYLNLLDIVEAYFENMSFKDFVTSYLSSLVLPSLPDTPTTTTTNPSSTSTSTSKTEKRNFEEFWFESVIDAVLDFIYELVPMKNHVSSFSLEMSNLIQVLCLPKWNDLSDPILLAALVFNAKSLIKSLSIESKQQLLQKFFPIADSQVKYEQQRNEYCKFTTYFYGKRTEKLNSSEIRQIVRFSTIQHLRSFFHLFNVFLDSTTNNNNFNSLKNILSSESIEFEVIGEKSDFDSTTKTRPNKKYKALSGGPSEMAMFGGSGNLDFGTNFNENGLVGTSSTTTTAIATNSMIGAGLNLHIPNDLGKNISFSDSLLVGEKRKRNERIISLTTISDVISFLNHLFLYRLLPM